MRHGAKSSGTCIASEFAWWRTMASICILIGGMLDGVTSSIFYFGRATMDKRGRTISTKSSTLIDLLTQVEFFACACLFSFGMLIYATAAAGFYGICYISEMLCIGSTLRSRAPFPASELGKAQHTDLVSLAITVNHQMWLMCSECVQRYEGIRCVGFCLRPSIEQQWTNDTRENKLAWMVLWQGFEVLWMRRSIERSTGRASK